jgi:hypothetical protein
MEEGYDMQMINSYRQCSPAAISSIHGWTPR